MKKRGEITLWFLVELIGAFLVAYLAVDISISYSQGTIFEKLNVAKDIAMQINTLQSMPGDAYIINKDLHGYSLQITGNKIEIFEETTDLVKGAYYFVKIDDSDISVLMKNPEQVIISKIGNEIKVNENIPD